MIIEQRANNGKVSEASTRHSRVTVLCRRCGKKVFDRVEAGTGVIEIKCSYCNHVNRITLSFRRGLLFRKSSPIPITREYRTHL